MRGNVYCDCPPSYLVPMCAAILCFSSLIVWIPGAKNCFLTEKRLVYLWRPLSLVLWNFLALLQVSVLQLLCHLYFLNYTGVYSRGEILTHPCVLFLFTHPRILFLFLLLFLWRGEPSHPTYCLCFCLFEGKNYLNLIVPSLFLWREITVSTLPFRYCVTVPLLILSGRTVSPCTVSCYCSWRENCLNLMTLYCFLLLFLWRGEICLNPILFSCYCSWREILSQPYPVLFSRFCSWRVELSHPVPVSYVFVRPRAPSWPCWERTNFGSCRRKPCVPSRSGVYGLLEFIVNVTNHNNIATI